MQTYARVHRARLKICSSASSRMQTYARVHRSRLKICSSVIEHGSTYARAARPNIGSQHLEGAGNEPSTYKRFMLRAPVEYTVLPVTEWTYVTAPSDSNTITSCEPIVSHNMKKNHFIEVRRPARLPSLARHKVATPLPFHRSCGDYLRRCIQGLPELCPLAIVIDSLLCSLLGAAQS